MILFDLAKLQKEVNELEAKIEVPDFWNNQQESTKVISKLKQNKNKFETYKKLSANLDNLIELNELLQIEVDPTLVKELLENTDNLEKDLEKFEVQTLLSGKYDKNNAIITLHPGAGRNRISRLGRNAI